MSNLSQLTLFPRWSRSIWITAWEQRKLGELYSLVSEKNDLTFGRESIISVANMYFNANVNVTDEQYLRTYNVMRLGDIAFEGHSNKEFSHGRFVENYIGDGIVSHIFTVLRPRVPFDVNYWRYAINNEKLMRLSLIRSTKASTMMHDLVPSDFLREAIPTPTLAEQMRIGTFFVGLDNLITLHQCKCQHCSLCGYLSWEQRKLGELLLFQNGFNGSSESFGSGIPLISVMDVLDDEFITHETVRGKARLNYEEASRYCVEYGDVLFQRSSENQEDAGTSNVYLDQHVPSAFGGFVIRGKKVDEYNPIFIKYLLGSSFIREQITHRAQGAQHINVSQDTLAGVVLLMPSMREQEAVGLVFLHLANLITLHR